jgi:hypothetical protein
MSSEKPYCPHCNKYYSSRNSLYNHNKKFHFNLSKTLISTQNHSIPLKNIQEPTNHTIPEPENKLMCKYCNKVYTLSYNRIRHEKTCKEKEAIEKEKELERTLKQKKEELYIQKQELEIELLKKKLQKSNKIETVTLQKLNKLLLERSNRINNYNVNSNNVQNITNNYQLIIGFGRENNIPSMLTSNEKRLIIDSRYSSLQKLIETIHCGRFNMFKNIIITNLKDDFLYTFDEKKGIFILSKKQDVLNTLIDYRVDDLETIYHELISENKVDERTKKCIEAFINKMNNYENNNDREYQINEIKMLLFNSKDKIANDISLLLTVNEVEKHKN